MTKTKPILSSSTTPPSPGQTPSAFHRLDALLHTLKCIAQYEDSLCELSHEIKRGGNLSPEAIEELRLILKNLPTHDYLLDVEAVRDLVSVQTAPKKSRAKKLTGPKSSSGKTVSVPKKPQRGRSSSK